MISALEDLDYHIVAFVDILGFSEMVKNDCENKNGGLKFFQILRDINLRTKEINDCDITQFSDSVIFSLPLSIDNYVRMIDILSSYQYELLYNSIVCRGAIAYGKHYKEQEFMFSQALIEAYQLEMTEAKYPRIIVSRNLLDFFRPCLKKLEGVLKERDGYYFVDYFHISHKDEIKAVLDSLSENIMNYNMNIKEKYYWLFEYWEFKFKEKLLFLSQHFIDENDANTDS